MMTVQDKATKVTEIYQDYKRRLNEFTEERDNILQEFTKELESREIEAIKARIAPPVI